MADDKKSNEKKSLSDSLFGGGLTDSTGLFGKPTAAAAAVNTDGNPSTNTHPPKRQRQRHEEKEQDSDEEEKESSRPKTPQELWEERQAKYAPKQEQEDGAIIMMDSWALAREQSTRIPDDVFAEEIGSTVKSYGLAVVKNILDPAILERLQVRAIQQRDEICQALRQRNLTWNEEANNTTEVRFQEVVVRCKGRMDVKYRYDDEHQDPNLPCTNFFIDHALLNKMIGMLLYGEEHTPKLVYAGWIFSFPGSADQPWHQDGIPLFPDEGITPNLPPYALYVFIPLQDADGSLEAGPTEFVVSSHRMTVGQAMEATKTRVGNDRTNSPCVACPVLKQGDMLIYDYRICHRGTSNLSHVLGNHNGRVRTILYLMYARPWFQEHLNFGTDKLFADDGDTMKDDSNDDNRMEH